MKDLVIETKKIKWREIQKNVFEKVCIEEKKGLKFSILKIKPGKKIPRHLHFDTRYNFILKGSMSDAHRTYQKGDLIINKKGTEHFLKAGPAGCEFILIWN